MADPNLLIGFDQADDAAVYKIADDRALVLTVDVITPIVDDPRSWGAIAATNAISDVYAMGGKPLVALAVAFFSPKPDASIYREVLRGASDAALSAGCPIVGGHTVKDDEIKYGLAVIGEIHPDEIQSNATAREGDVLILTQSLGSAALATAFKQGAFDENDEQYTAMLEGMLLSNGEASRILIKHGCHALTDVTGFGLSGHGLEMAEASGVGIELDHTNIPTLPGALDRLRDGFSCGGAGSNARRAEKSMSVTPGIAAEWVGLIHDPQTSGPLLAAISPENSASAVEELRNSGYVNTQTIGRIVPATGARLRLL